MPQHAHTHLIVDGLYDPQLAGELSRRWMEMGLLHAVDPASQSAWLASADGQPLTEDHVEQAAAMARRFGVEVRDRAGTQFVAANDPQAMRSRMAYEYKSRFATALVFGVPALALHYGAGMLTGSADGPRAMLYPWLFSWLLAGWACVAAGWPILWNGGLAARHLRATSDLLTTAIMLASLLPAAAGVVTLIVTGRTWLGVSRADGPMLHAALAAVLLATLQRWRFYAEADRLSGRVMLMIPHHGRAVAMWLGLSAAAWVWHGREMGLAIALLWPPLLSLGAINRWSPGVSMALPVVAFAVLDMLGPGALQLPIRGVAIEIAAGFGLMMTGVFVCGWRGWGRSSDAKPQA